MKRGADCCSSPERHHRKMGSLQKDRVKNILRRKHRFRKCDQSDGEGFQLVVQ